MNIYSSSDKQLELKIGIWIKGLRLKKNLSQKSLAEQSGLSLNTVKALEVGRGKLSSLTAVLRVLGELDRLSLFMVDDDISPMQLLKLKGKQRLRASKAMRKDDRDNNND